MLGAIDALTERITDTAVAGALSAHGLPTTYKSPRREKASATPAVAFDTDVDAERAKGRPPKRGLQNSMGPNLFHLTRTATPTSRTRIR